MFEKCVFAMNIFNRVTEFQLSLKTYQLICALKSLQETTDTARSTVLSISNAAMYLGETLGGLAGGILITRITGFWGISIFTVILAIVPLIMYF